MSAPRPRPVAIVLLVLTAHAQAEPVCPAKLKARALPLVFAKNIDAARTLLMKNTEGQHDDIMAPAVTTPAFGVETRKNFHHGSASSNWESHAVFQIKKGVVIAPRIAKHTVVIPAECAEPRQEVVLEARVEIVKGRTLGIVRVRRYATEEATSLPAVATTTKDAECAKTTRYRIEDHVFDLDKRRELLVSGGVYEGPSYEDHAPPLPPLAQLVLTEKSLGVVDPGCINVAWRR